MEDDLVFNPGEKKKKKKKEKFVLDEPDGAPAAVNDEAVDTPTPNDEDLPELPAFDMKKKKKSSKRTTEPSAGADEGAWVAPSSKPGKRDRKREVEPEAEAQVNEDYYNMLLERIYSIMHAKNPDRDGSSSKLVIPVPQISRVGTKRTAVTNFGDICKTLKRKPRHLFNYLMAELGTDSASVDANNQLIIKGRFQQKHFENVLREYILCHTCKSPDTELEKKDRLEFLQCQTCQSRCSVATIKAGFQAVVGKRAHLRTKKQ